MTLNIPVLYEGPRGCGYRKVGGIYLVADGLGKPCGRIPLAMTTCPCCGAGIKPARGWTWVISPDSLVASLPPCPNQGCNTCPLNGSLGARAGLLWIGEKFYPTPEKFQIEAVRMGVSRRISQVPRGFEVGKTWVLLGHRKGISHEDGSSPAIMFTFRPQRVEKVVTGHESPEEIEKLIKRGFSPVIVQHIQGSLEDTP